MRSVRRQFEAGPAVWSASSQLAVGVSSGLSVLPHTLGRASDWQRNWTADPVEVSEVSMLCRAEDSR